MFKFAFKKLPVGRKSRYWYIATLRYLVHSGCLYIERRVLNIPCIIFPQAHLWIFTIQCTFERNEIIWTSYICDKIAHNSEEEKKIRRRLKKEARKYRRCKEKIIQGRRSSWRPITDTGNWIRSNGLKIGRKKCQQRPARSGLHHSLAAASHTIEV